MKNIFYGRKLVENLVREVKGIAGFNLENFVNIGARYVIGSSTNVVIEFSVSMATAQSEIDAINSKIDSFVMESVNVDLIDSVKSNGGTVDFKIVKL